MDQPDKKTIICYCGGGLGNRLMPLAACRAIARLTGRQLKALWRHTDKRCEVGFTDLFANDLDIISDEQLAALTDCTIYADLKDVYENFYLTRREALIKLIESWGIHDRNHIVLDDPAQNIIVYHNSFLKGIDTEMSRQFIEQLQPAVHLRRRITEWTRRLNIDRTVMGVHARGTDFHVSVNQYAEKIQSVLRRIPGQRFLVCSDDLGYEQELLKLFPHNVVSRFKQDHVRRADHRTTWINNMVTSRQAVEEAVVDVYLLARTDFKIFHIGSSFARLVQMVATEASI